MSYLLLIFIDTIPHSLVQRVIEIRLFYIVYIRLKVNSQTVINLRIFQIGPFLRTFYFFICVSAVRADKLTYAWYDKSRCCYNKFRSVFKPCYIYLTIVRLHHCLSLRLHIPCKYNTDNVLCFSYKIKYFTRIELHWRWHLTDERPPKILLLFDSSY